MLLTIEKSGEKDKECSKEWLVNTDTNPDTLEFRMEAILIQTRLNVGTESAELCRTVNPFVSRRHFSLAIILPVATMYFVASVKHDQPAQTCISIFLCPLYCTIFVAFVEDNATMRSIRYTENHVRFFVEVGPINLNICMTNNCFHSTQIYD